ncbi:hypothetical protein E2C01_013877 [Portunus trituberculatus]|uniref:Uncharacterized protein n=1 Tax=Portunus trituberculatus TaxID=210409 RepID=A0A5B7DII7_PORTR|nr:hypothetical protein [Portunus trituberculatus]
MQCESPLQLFFVCATLCSASVGMNSGNLPPTGGTGVVRTMVVVARTKVGEGNG